MSSERVLPSHFSVDERMQSDRVPRPVTGKFQSVHSINGLSNRSNSLGRSDVKGRSIENYSRLIKQHTEKDAYDERILNEKTRGSHKGEATSLSQQFQHASNMFFNRWWLWELFACFVTLCALIGIVVVLARFNNNPLPNWPYHIGINSLISVFTTLLKAAMLLVLTEGISQLKWVWFQQPRPLKDLADFDHASRGPLGAFRLLYTLRLHHLAAVGALVTVVAIAVDPFTQQAVRFYSCSRPAPNANATLPRANIYDQEGTHVGAGQNILDLPLKAAISNGLSDSGGNYSSVPVHCPSGSCSFAGEIGAFTTLGICNECADISSLVNVTHYPNTTSPQGITYTLYNYTLPNGLLLNQPVIDSGYTSTPYIFTSPQWNTPTNPSLFHNTLASIGNLSVLSFTLDNGTSSSTRANHHYAEPPPGYGPDSLGYNVMAVQCNLYLCTKTYNATVTEGKLSETIVSSRGAGPPDLSDVSDLSVYGATTTVPLPCLIDGVPYNLSAVSGHFPNNPRYTFYNASGQNTYVLNDCVYQVTQAPWLGLTDYFNDVSGVSGSPFTGEGDGFYLYDTVQFSPYWIEPFYNKGYATLESVNETMTALSTSMTNVIRTSGTNSTPALGIIMDTETCVHVEWAWLALPIALVCLSVLFLFATILQTQRHAKHHVWKSSLFALLFHGLSTETRGGLGLMTHLDEMEDAAQEVKVQLRLTGNGWRFVEGPG